MVFLSQNLDDKGLSRNLTYISKEWTKPDEFFDLTSKTTFGFKFTLWTIRYVHVVHILQECFYTGLALVSFQCRRYCVRHSSLPELFLTSNRKESYSIPPRKLHITECEKVKRLYILGRKLHGRKSGRIICLHLH